MVSTKFIMAVGLFTTAMTAASALPQQRTYGCGEVSVIFTGLPPYHPLVVSQGFNATAVDIGLREDAAAIVAAGYNSRVVLMGPEQPISVLDDQMRGHNWDGTGTGYGVRGSHLQNLTLRFADIQELYRRNSPAARLLYDYSFTTALWAIQERFPIVENCKKSPGTDLGFNIFCDPDFCVQNS